MVQFYFFKYFPYLSFNDANVFLIEVALSFKDEAQHRFDFTAS